MSVKLLGSDHLPDGSVIDVYYSTSLPSSPATPYLLKHFSELMIHGFTPSYGIPLSNEHSIIWAVKDSKIAGGICFSFEKFVQRCWVQFSFTEHDFRRQGIYKQLHKHLEKICKSSDIEFIANYVHINNQAILKSCESVGMKPQFIRMIKNL